MNITQKTFFAWGYALALFCNPFCAHALTVQQPIYEGGLVYGTLDTGEELTFDGKKIIPDKNGRFVFGIPQDAPNTLSLTVRGEKHTYPVHKRQWDEEKINGLPPQTIQPNPKNQKRIQAENKIIIDNRAFFTTDFFPVCFSDPVPEKRRISGTFGARRIYNGVKKGGHSGVDYAAPTGTPVLAPADGIVRITHPDMFLTGKTVLVDHGHGIYTSYSHLSHIDVKENQIIKRGERLGKIGTTGRSTGPHLHFVMTWFGVRVDPDQTIQTHMCP